MLSLINPTFVFRVEVIKECFILSFAVVYKLWGLNKENIGMYVRWISLFLFFYKMKSKLRQIESWSTERLIINDDV